MRIVIGSIVAIGILATASAQSQPAAGLVERLDPAIDALIAPDAKVETIYTEAHFFEGPVWHHGKEGNFLTFTDIPGNSIDKWENGKVTPYVTDIFKGKDTSATTTVDRDGRHFLLIGPDGATLDREGRLVFCAMGSGEIVRREADGKLTVLADAFEGHHLNAPNDLVVKSDGAIYFTDIRGGSVTKDKNPPDGAPRPAVYRWKNGTVTLLTAEVGNPNGLAFSPDEKYLYVNAARMKSIWRFDVKPDGTIASGKIFVDMSGDTRPGSPDGMRIDVKGNIWDSGPGGLWVITPEGKHIATIHTPYLTNLAWGDADAKTLYLTGGGFVARLRTTIEGVRP